MLVNTFSVSLSSYINDQLIQVGIVNRNLDDLVGILSDRGGHFKVETVRVTTEITGPAKDTIEITKVIHYEYVLISEKLGKFRGATIGDVIAMAVIATNKLQPISVRSGQSLT